VTFHKINFDIDNGTVIVFSDAHFWDEEPNTAYRALIHFIKELNPKLIVANGDIFDGATNSRHASIGWEKKPSLIQELKACKAMMDGVVKSAAKGTQLTWCIGNHDSRFETYLAAHAPQYQEVEGFSLKDHFPEWRMCWATWINGHTVVKHRWKGGIHATHNNTVNSGVSIVTGHLHSLKVTPFTDYTGTRYGVDTGCLADTDGNQFVNYLETNPTNWRSGFAVLNFDNGKLLPPELVQVIDEGVVAFRGKSYEV
jgi:predicted phosphodiesterase